MGRPKGWSDGGRARFGVVIPVHNEDELVGEALASLDRAITRALDAGMVDVGVAIVLDACWDRSGEIVLEWGRHVRHSDRLHVQILQEDQANVGVARRVGCQALLAEWFTVAPGDIWLATTDADSEVPSDWITSQMRMRRGGAQVWVGGVGVRDWSGRSAATVEAWHRQGETECLPIYGANFGIDAETYLRVGGFQALPSGEDRALFEQALAVGAVIHTDPTVRVLTSGRRVARAPDGFADALNTIEMTVGSSHATELSAS
jgi:Glycosyl transferase family 2